MGTFGRYVCDSCGHEVRIGGPVEFYRHDGERLVYGHPIPVSREAEAAGISGLQIDQYCTSCRLEFDWVLVEFVAPATPEQVFAATARPLPEYLEDPSEGLPEHPERFTFRPRQAKCPQCGSAGSLLGRAAETGPCPEEIGGRACPGLLRFDCQITT